MRAISQRKNKVRSQRGAILVLFILMIPFLFGMTAISVDVSHLFLVRSELKKATVASSLAGASYLYPSTPDGQPNWSLAEQKALEAISWNSADGITLSFGVIETGYWDLTGEVPGIRAPSTVTDPGVNDIPAVRVEISRAPGENGGSVPLYFGSFVGVNSKDVSTDSVAVTGAPRAVEEGTLFPTVIPLNIYAQYWDYSSQKPKNDPTTGSPYVFEIKADENGQNGEWTSFEEDINNVPYIRDLIENGNPTALAIGEEVYVAPGTKTALYASVPSDIDVTIVILGDTQTGGEKEVVGFGAMHIHFATGGNEKSITVNLTENHKTNGGSPTGGAYYGTYVPPKLAY